MHDHQVRALADSPPPVAAAASQSVSDAHAAGAATRVDFFMDPYSGWTCWIPRWPVEAELGAKEAPTAASQRRPGQGLLVRLAGRVGAWFGICEPSPSGGWRRRYVPRRDPWAPGARHSGVFWSWWC